MEPRKSLIAKMPVGIDWTENNFRSFLRGMFDGDGSIFYNSSSQHYGISIIGSCEQMAQIKKMIKNFLNMDFSFKVSIQSSIQTASIEIHGNNKVKEFCDWLYQDSSIHLTRKHKKYIGLCDNRKAAKARRLS